MTTEQITEATERGTAWGEQEAAAVQDDINNGHLRSWPEWTFGAYCGELPHARPTLLANLTIWQGRTAEQETERADYEDILDRAAMAAYNRPPHATY